MQSQKLFYLGVDPGYAHGALAVLGENFEDIAFSDIGEDLGALCEFFALWGPHIKTAIMEKVGAMPRQGVTSSLNFGRGIGWCEALLTNYKIPFEYATPQRWMEVITGRPSPMPIDKTLPGNEQAKVRAKNKRAGKEYTYNFCKRKFPNAELRSFNKDTNRADALGIAFYCWSQYRSI